MRSNLTAPVSVFASRYGRKFVDNLSVVQILIILGILLLIVNIIFLYFSLWQQKCFLSQQLQRQQELIENTFAAIHNGAMQNLAFIIREVEIHQVSQQQLLEYLRDVYQNILADIENLDSNQN